MSTWIVCPKVRPAARQRLFCFPYAGGGIAVFRDWSEDLGPDVEVCCIQLPGRGQRLRERPFDSMREFIPLLVEALRPWLDRPYAFYGHSLGARIAFEVARALRRSGWSQPAHLFAAASPAPQAPWPHPPMHGMQEDQFLDEIQKRYGGVPKQVVEDPEMRALLIPMLRADVTIMETYTYQAEVPLGCAITAIGGAADHTVRPAVLDRWRDQTSGNYALHVLEGDHFFLHTKRQRLLALISAELGSLPGSPLAVTQGV
jgi:medium-chain acyl-[acyl-carrier-protein] hydrolase